ncbi:hypothetical protein KCU61_g502, partial [Aureobasidium melanogenum]
LLHQGQNVGPHSRLASSQADFGNALGYEELGETNERERRAIVIEGGGRRGRWCSGRGRGRGRGRNTAPFWSQTADQRPKTATRAEGS